MLIFLQILGGIIFLFMGGESIVRSSALLSHSFKLPPLRIGMIMVLVGTYCSELFLIFSNPTFSIDQISPQNIFSLGHSIDFFPLFLLQALIITVSVRRNLITSDAAIVTMVAVLDLISSKTGLSLALLQGLLVCIGLLRHFVFLQRNMYIIFNHSRKMFFSRIENPSLLQPFCVCFMGLILVVSGAFLLTQGSLTLSENFGFSEMITGNLLIALGSITPEIVTSWIAIVRKHPDYAAHRLFDTTLFNAFWLTFSFTGCALTSFHSFIIHNNFLITCIITGIVFLILHKMKEHAPKYIGQLSLTLYSAFITAQFVN